MEHDRNLYVMGTIDIQKRDYMCQTRKLADLFQTGRIVAAKIFPEHDPIYPTDKRLTPLYELCVRHDLPVVIHTARASVAKNMNVESKDWHFNVESHEKGVTVDVAIKLLITRKKK